MDVRCERCNAQYTVDDGLVHDEGLAVRCAMCGHSFKVMKSLGWSLRKTTGDVYPVPDSATLQRWVVEGRVTREDEVAEPGAGWVRAGSREDLEPFFAVLDQARRARTVPQGTPLPGHEPPRDARTQTGEIVLGDPMPPPSDTWEAPRPRLNADEPAWATGRDAGGAARRMERVPVAPQQPRKEKAQPTGRGWPVLLLVFVALIVLGLAMGVTVFLFKPEWIPPEFSQFLKEWSISTVGSEKVAADGSARPPAPAAPESRPSERTSTPPPPAPRESVEAPKANPTPPPAPRATAETPPTNPAPAADGASSSAGAAPAAPAGAAETVPKPADTNAPAAASGEPAPPAGTVPSAEATKAPPQPTKAAPPPEKPAEAPAPKERVEKQVAEKKPAAEKKPDPAARSKALLAQARSLRDRGNSNAALDAYARAIQANPNNAEALAGRGLAYLDLSRYRQAEESFKEALAVNGSHPAALMGLAETYRYEGKRSDAVTYYRRYLAAHPRGEDATAARKAIEALEESP